MDDRFETLRRELDIPSVDNWEISSFALGKFAQGKLTVFSFESSTSPGDWFDSVPRLALKNGFKVAVPTRKTMVSEILVESSLLDRFGDFGVAISVIRTFKPARQHTEPKSWRLIISFSDK
jgi:hypothetical protein